MKRILRAADAWWPVLSRNGQDLVAGNVALRAWHLPALTNESTPAHWSIGPGRNGRFIRRSVVTFTREISTLRHERWEYDLRTGEARVTQDDPALVAGNTFDADESGHWASWLQAGNRIAYDNRIISDNGYGLCVAGNQVAYKDFNAGKFVVRNPSAGLFARYDLPADANNFTLSPEGYIGYGYYWPARVITTDGAVADVTASPWRREGVPVLCRANGVLWVWTWTQRPGDNQGIVMGRPFAAGGPQHCVQVPFDADAWLSVSFDGTYFVVAGCSSVGGTMECWLVSPNEPLEPMHDEYIVRASSKPLVYTAYYDISTRYSERYDFPSNADIIVEPATAQKTTLPRILPADFLGDVASPTDVYALLSAGEDETRIEDEAERQRALWAKRFPSAPCPPFMQYLLPGMVERGWDPLQSTVDVFMPQFYFDFREPPSFEAIARWFTYWRQKLPTDRPWVLTTQAYDRNGVVAGAMWDLAAVTPRFLDLANNHDFIKGLAWFSSERPGGAADYPQLQDVHAKCFAVLPNVLPVLPVRDDMPLKTPAITVDAWGQELTPNNNWKVDFHDRENNTHVQVRLESGKLWLEMSNAKGVGKTGAVRIVNIHS